jgi:DNA-binding transcriptional regulator YiaG
VNVVTAAAEARADYLAFLRPWQVRACCGISQQVIADALGVSQATVSYWESGERRPSGARGAAYLRVIEALARHLAVEIPEGEQSAAPLSLAA